MFYTSIITSLLPYILLFGVFSTLLLNRIACSNNNVNTERGYVAYKKKQKIDASRTYLISLEKERYQKEQPEPRINNTYRLSGITNTFLNKAKKIYRHTEFVLVSIPGRNNAFCLRGPPA
jgi:hypothetical protein